MTGETDLARLLAAMSPELAEGVYIFATLLPGEIVPPAIEPLMVFRESEGTTLILRAEEAASAGLSATFRCRMITLNIHSALDAVGFLATILPRLAEAGMGVNPVSGFYHDHLFVPAERAQEAMEVLRRLAAFPPPQGEGWPASGWPGGEA